MTDSSNHVINPVDILPPELFLAVLETLQSSRQNLVHCSLVCRAWSRIAQKVLHQHVFLNERTIERFCDGESCIAPRMQDVIQTLTIRFEYNESPLDSSIMIASSFGYRIAEMTNLKCLSYYWATASKALELLALNILERLPVTCTSIEIENDSKPRNEKVHICSLIRALLPRLRHLRITWPNLCPELFEAKYGKIENVWSTLPVNKSDLESCIICALDWLAGNCELCDYEDEDMDEALQPILRSISRRLELGNISATKNITVMSTTDKGRSSRDWSRLVRHEFATGKSRSFPFGSRGVSEDDEYLIRLPKDEGGDCVGRNLAKLIDVAEKRVWRTTAEGVRLPTVLMRHFGLKSISPVMCRAEWEEENSRQYPTWRYEDRDLSLFEVQEGDIHEQLGVEEQP